MTIYGNTLYNVQCTQGCSHDTYNAYCVTAQLCETRVVRYVRHDRTCSIVRTTSKSYGMLRIE